MKLAQSLQNEGLHVFRVLSVISRQTRQALVSQTTQAFRTSMWFPVVQSRSAMQGVVSGLQREIQATSYGPKIKGVIQTDAAINPGNSGGILLNSQGKLIGVNSAILDPSQRGAFSGVGTSKLIASALSIPLVQSTTGASTLHVEVVLFTMHVLCRLCNTDRHGEGTSGPDSNIW